MIFPRLAWGDDDDDDDKWHDEYNQGSVTRFEHFITFFLFKSHSV